jgi:hypothetical protein
MWIFSEGGFISAVAHREKKDTLLVRSRDRVSVEPLAKFAEVGIKTTPDADYRYRIEVSKTVFSAWMADQIADLDYDNYKNRVHQTRGNEFAAPLHDVWSVMLEVDDVRGGPSKRWVSHINDWDLD